jgi:hypothetical protein
LWALHERHEQQVAEMKQRGWIHKTPIRSRHRATGQPPLINTVRDQIQMLRSKGCACRV